MKKKAILFDLDGVVLDSEHHYTQFWRQEGLRYHPEQVGLAEEIKGCSLKKILDRWFGDVASQHKAIVQRLDEFERNLPFDYIPGVTDFLKVVKAQQFKTAIVTSSTRQKMQYVSDKHPELRHLIDVLVTGDDVSQSKPSPEGYLHAAHQLGVEPEECAVFEDSINGLKAGRAAGMITIALTTTNPRELLADNADLVVDDFTSDELIKYIL